MEVLRKVKGQITIFDYLNQQKGFKVLSLFDGISCGRVALERAGIPVKRYVAYEIDKYAIQVSEKNYPEIEHKGDVFDADFKDYQGFDLLLGGSPCTYWSIAKNNRETTPDGIGGQLFMQYVRALKESGCRWFLYENNYSIHPNIKAFISEQLGVEPIMINSALVSAQTRKRCYWTNIPGVEQPQDLGIVVDDILVEKMKSNYTSKQNKPICVNSKSGRGGREGLQPSVQDRIYSVEGKSTAITTSFLPWIEIPIQTGC